MAMHCKLDRRSPRRGAHVSHSHVQLCGLMLVIRKHIAQLFSLA